MNLIGFFFFCFEKGSHFVAQDDIEFEILLPPLPKCWDYRNEMNILFSNQAKMANKYMENVQHSYSSEKCKSKLP
jgi:hypothetical protein